MGVSEERSDLIVHPSVSAKLEEIDVLREKLSALIEEHESLLHGERDLLMAQYNRDIGYLEHELFLLDIELAELRRRISILQADINQGKTVTAERLVRLDEGNPRRVREFHAEVKEKERELRRSVGLLETVEWMKPEHARELKLLYRRICQHYHPDVGGEKAERGKQIWSTLQHAYRTGDLDLLKALAETLDLSKKTTPEASDDLNSEIKRLNSQIKKQSKRLAKTLPSHRSPIGTGLKIPSGFKPSRKNYSRRLPVASNTGLHCRAGTRCCFHLPVPPTEHEQGTPENRAC